MNRDDSGCAGKLCPKNFHQTKVTQVSARLCQAGNLVVSRKVHLKQYSSPMAIPGMTFVRP